MKPTKRMVRAIAQYHLEDRAQSFREEVAIFLHKADRWAAPFDLIFADPPYHECHAAAA